MAVSEPLDRSVEGFRAPRRPRSAGRSCPAATGRSLRGASKTVVPPISWHRPIDPRCRGEA